MNRPRLVVDSLIDIGQFSTDGFRCDIERLVPAERVRREIHDADPMASILRHEGLQPKSGGAESEGRDE